jgi:hypothetical protein
MFKNFMPSKEIFKNNMADNLQLTPMLHIKSFPQIASVCPSGR